MTPIGVKFFTMVHIGPDVASPFWVRYPRHAQNPQFWSSTKANISKTVSRSVTCQLELKNQLDKSFLKCIARHPWESPSYPWESPIRKICYFFARGQISRADRREKLHDGRALFLHFWWRYLLGLQIWAKHGTFCTMSSAYRGRFVS